MIMLVFTTHLYIVLSFSLRMSRVFGLFQFVIMSGNWYWKCYGVFTLRRRIFHLNFKKKLFRMLTIGLSCAATDLLIRCLQPGVKCVVRGKWSDTSCVFPQISPGIHLELGRFWLSLQGNTCDLCSKPNKQQHQDLNPWPQYLKLFIRVRQSFTS